MGQHLKGALFILLSACGFGVMPVFALHAYPRGINVPTLLLLRFTLAGLLLFGFLFASPRYRAAMKLRAVDLFYLFLLGICYTLQSTLYFTAVRHITPTLVALLFYTYPILVVALNCLLERRKPSLSTAVAGAVSFMGVLLILGTTWGSADGVGTLLAFSAALVYVVYILLGHRVIKQIPPLIATTFITVFAGMGVLATSIFTGPLDFSFEPSAWGPIAVLVLFSTITALLAFFRGLEMLGPARASILSMSEPLFTALGAAIMLQERLTAVQLIGGAAVLAGAVLISWTGRERPCQGSALER